MLLNQDISSWSLEHHWEEEELWSIRVFSEGRDAVSTIITSILWFSVKISV